MSNSALYTFTATDPIDGTSATLQFTDFTVAHDARFMAEAAGYRVERIHHPTTIHNDAESAMESLHAICGS